MAQPPEATTAPVPALDSPGSLLELAPGYVFRPSTRCLLDHYLVPKALDGRVAERNTRDSVAEGVDVYAVRPAALPFQRRNRDEYGHVWGYFFTTRPADAAGAAGGSSAGSSHHEFDDVREVAAGGRWRRYGGDKGYVGADGEPYAFRRRFAFHEPVAGGNGERRTPWRMKEFRLNEAAPAFRGVAFHPSAEGLVIWMVHNQVILDDDEYDGSILITAEDAIAAAAPPPAAAAA